MRFDSYHPTINFIFFAVMIAAVISFDHPVFLLLGYLCPFIYSVALEKTRALVIDLILIPLIFLFAGYYGFYHHFGVTVLSVNFIGNSITLESLVYGGVLAVKTASLIMWMICIHSIVSDDKVIYLLGRLCPRLSLLLAILLRMIPRIRVRAGRVEQSQRCIGRGIGQGQPFRRVGNFFREMSIIVTWTLDDLIRSSDSMKSRGYSLKGRTAFSIYRFDNRDRMFVVALFAGFTVMLMGVLLDQTRTIYGPEILINPISPMSFVFYLIYVLIGLLPLLLQLIGEHHLQKLTRRLS